MRDPLILPLILTGWRHSIHTAIVRLTLAEKGVAARFVEVDQFRTPDAAGLSPFGMVPVLRQGEFTLYETGAICRWIDEGFDGPALQPGIRRRGHGWSRPSPSWMRMAFARCCATITGGGLCAGRGRAAGSGAGFGRAARGDAGSGRAGRDRD